jgi:hypothetical protein
MIKKLFNNSMQSNEWEDPQAEQDMNDLLRVRTAVLSALEKARGQKYSFELCLTYRILTYALGSLRAP